MNIDWSSKVHAVSPDERADLSVVGLLRLRRETQRDDDPGEQSADYPHGCIIGTGLQAVTALSRRNTSVPQSGMDSKRESQTRDES